jgi:carboxypeptidase C (cathepsin A)
MTLNGVVLLSSLLDMRTLDGGPGDDLACLTYLPTMTSVAHFHGKIQGDRDALIESSRQFAFGPYAAALLKGGDLPAAERDAIAKQLASLTGLSEAWLLAHRLRIDPAAFRAELLRAEQKSLGRFDARVVTANADPATAYPDGDPSFDIPFGVFATAMLDYLATGLGWKDEQPYEILTGKVNPWRWGGANTPPNVSNRLAQALVENPHLNVLVMCGRNDLATPNDAIAYSVRHMDELPAARRGAIRFTWYDGGHMFYLNPPDLAKMHADLAEFVNASVPAP